MLLLYVSMCSDIIDDINTIYINDKHTNKIIGASSRKRKKSEPLATEFMFTDIVLI